MDSSTILLIDDDRDICAVWSMMLEAEGFSPFSAFDGPAGLAEAREHLPDIIICDFMMPAMDGVAVCRAIREDERLKNAFVILWSAARNIEANGWADMVVEKPVDVATFLGHIKAAGMSRRKT
ncbi:response regulator transcription factor [Caballeronia temeraria]|uniref:response regulator transcription factor n=1 Tax=Caballeronia temeraria TaxID=1777137 RepID=UPI00077287E8|nr:response regulator [Caballeronia temeraria]